MAEFPEYQHVSKTLSLRTKVGQLFMPAAFIHDTEEHIQALEDLVRTHHIGGLCFFHSPESVATNFEGKRQIAHHPDSLQRLKSLVDRYQKAAQYPLFTAMDAEWGLAMRVENAPAYPYALALGALQDIDDPLLYQLGLRMAADCLEAGINWNLTPVVDINTNPENPVIGYRAFGNRADRVTEKSLQLFKGLEDAGVLSCLKHFPGHGDTAIDSHLDLPVLEKSVEELEREEFLPFRNLIQAGATAIMTGHLSVPSLDATGLPASLSERIVHYLRQQLGFQGALITDALNMKALRSIEDRPAHINLRALQAGNDILCFAEDIPKSVELILETLPESHLEASFKRVWRLKSRIFRGTAQSIGPKYGPDTLNQKLCSQSLCLIGTGSQDIGRWREAGTCLLYYNIRPDVFLDRIGEHLNLQERQWKKDQSITQIGLPDNPRVVLALQPPSMKPKEGFGLSESFFSELLRLVKEKEVLLYLFGNPYLLNRFPGDGFEHILCAFQPMAPMQEAAARHFLGKLRAVGKLPVTINTADNE